MPCHGLGASWQLLTSVLAWKNLMDRGDMAGYIPWGHRESDTTEQLNNNSVLQTHGQKHMERLIAKTFVC